MLTVTSFYNSGVFRVAEVTAELAATHNEAFHRRFPSGAGLVETHIATGELSEAGDYRLVYDAEGNCVTYEKYTDPV